MTTVTVTDYITMTEFRDYIGSDSGIGNKQAVAELAISTASREIDAFCGRNFFQQDLTLYFSPEQNNLWILDFGDNDLATTSGLTVHVEFGIDGTYPEVRTFGTDFICEPINQSVNGIGGWPFTYLRAINGKIWPQRYIDYYRDTVKIVGTFGWPAVPDPVKQATKIIAAQRYKMSDAPLGYNAINGWGEVRVKDIPLVASILQPYQKANTKFLIA